MQDWLHGHFPKFSLNRPPISRVCPKPLPPNLATLSARLFLARVSHVKRGLHDIETDFEGFNRFVSLDRVSSTASPEISTKRKTSREKRQQQKRQTENQNKALPLFFTGSSLFLCCNGEIYTKFWNLSDALVTTFLVIGLARTHTDTAHTCTKTPVAHTGGSEFRGGAGSVRKRFSFRKCKNSVTNRGK